MLLVGRKDGVARVTLAGRPASGARVRDTAKRIAEIRVSPEGRTRS